MFRSCVFFVVLFWSQLVIDLPLVILCYSHSTTPIQWMDVVLLPTIYQTEFYNGKTFGLNGGDTENYQGYHTHPRACMRTHMHSNIPMSLYSLTRIRIHAHYRYYTNEVLLTLGRVRLRQVRSDHNCDVSLSLAHHGPVYKDGEVQLDSPTIWSPGGEVGQMTVNGPADGAGIQKCYPAYSEFFNDRQDMVHHNGNGSKVIWEYRENSDGAAWGPSHKTGIKYPQGGYREDLPLVSEAPRGRLHELRDMHWIDDYTRAIFVDVQLYSPSVSLAPNFPNASMRTRTKFATTTPLTRTHINACFALT